MKFHFVLGFCIDAQGAKRLKTAVSGLGSVAQLRTRVRAMQPFLTPPRARIAPPELPAISTEVQKGGVASKLCCTPACFTQRIAMSEVADGTS